MVNLGECRSWERAFCTIRLGAHESRPQRPGTREGAPHTHTHTNTTHTGPPGGAITQLGRTQVWGRRAAEGQHSRVTREGARPTDCTQSPLPMSMFACAPRCAGAPRTKQKKKEEKEDKKREKKKEKREKEDQNSEDSIADSQRSLMWLSS